ncbi:hypothetical protein [Sporosarcina limicola]|uniref:Integrase n=1 Tax=Sporosarcina limicola TaxID=34101 RepID=A0A927MLR8_9BACL|nr:hypothetical protein [Sporosarcina limicola]MBE1556296.1 integrase [Sporosarcina limicola]
MNKFVVREYKIEEIIGETIIKTATIGIGFVSKDTGNVYPSPLTNFIKSNYRRKGKSLSSQRNAAYAITRFLNYIEEQIEEGDDDFLLLKTKGLSGLELIHGSKYITHLSLQVRIKKLSANYVKNQMMYIIYFYAWLRDQEIIEGDFELTYKEVRGKRGVLSVASNPFDDIELGTVIVGRDERVPTALVDFGSNRYPLTLKFINTARLIAPEIALGICYQFFGGLRRSEVINLTKQSIKQTGKSTILEVRDNQEILFSHIKNTSHLQVKNPRNQALLANDLTDSIYREHLTWLEQSEKDGKAKSNQALFISPTTGNPMTGKQYYIKFTEVKMKFLKQLSDEGNTDDYLLLAQNDWSTHIGRGVFTNFLLDIGLNSTQVAIARGDNSINSSLAYIDEKTAIESMNLAVNNIREAFQRREALIDDEYTNKWRRM